MPQNVHFRFPVAFRLSPDLERARTRNLEWVRSHRLATTDEAVARYDSWDMTKLAAYMYPYATGADLDLAADLMGFRFPFDDQFEGPLGNDPARAARICHEMTAVVHDPEALSADASPAARAFADMWRRSIDGMSSAWRSRAAHNWEYYFNAYPNEAIARRRGTPLSRQEYLHLRRGSSGGRTVVDMCERLGGFEVPPGAFHSPELRTMRRIATDVPAFCNDVHSVEKEAARGDVHNLVLVVQNERHCPLPEAIDAVQGLIDDQLDTFERLWTRIPELSDRLGLDADRRTAADRYVETMALWMPGYHQWAVETARYAAHGVIPADEPAYPEALLA